MRALRLAGRANEARNLVENEQENALDVQVLRELARSTAAVARTHENNDVAAAAEAYQVAVDTCKRALEREPEDKETLILLSELLTGLGDALQDAGELRRAHEIFLELMEFDRALASRFEDDRDLQRSVAASLERLSSIFTDMGNVVEAKQNIEDALKIREEDVARNPDDEEKILFLGACYGALARIQAEEGDLGAAAEATETAIRTIRRVGSERQLSAPLRVELASAN